MPNEIDPRLQELHDLGVPEDEIHSHFADMHEDMRAEEYLCRRYLFTGLGFYSWMTEKMLEGYKTKARQDAKLKKLARSIRPK